VNFRDIETISISKTKESDKVPHGKGFPENLVRIVGLAD